MDYRGELWSRHAVLAVIMGIRAGQMNCLDYIDLPEGEEGEEEVASFCLEQVSLWLNSEEEFSFDEFIETALEKEYGTEDW